MSAQWTEQQQASRDVCLANWPEAESMAYDPRCCRFPKSCSVEEPPASTEVAVESSVPSTPIREEVIWEVERMLSTYGVRDVDWGRMFADELLTLLNGEGKQ